MEALNRRGIARRSIYFLLKVFVCCLSVLTVIVFFENNRALSNENSNADCVAYGISCDSLQVIKDVVKRNQNLAKILLSYNVPHTTINDVAQKSKGIFDVRKFRAGNPYIIMRKPAPEKTARYFIYEQDPVNYVVYNLGNPTGVYAGEKPVEIRIRAASSQIDSSLYQAVYKMGMNYELAEQLSDLYAWTIDFHHLQKGDNFRIIFEQQYSDGISIGMGNILAAKFHHDGSDYYAFYFEADGKGGYYDEDANTMEKAFLKAPLRFTCITSRPSKSRLHPIFKVRKPHLGTDYAAPAGTPIYAVGDGIIDKSGYRRGYGKFITIKHSTIYKTEYLHLSKIKKGIKPGVRVNRGDEIGNVGQTGWATGPHLDFRFWKNGKVFDHIHADLSAGKPLDEKYMEQFKTKIKTLKQQLDRIPRHEIVDVAKLEAP